MRYGAIQWKEPVSDEHVEILLHRWAALPANVVRLAIRDRLYGLPPREFRLLLAYWEHWLWGSMRRARKLRLRRQIRRLVGVGRLLRAARSGGPIGEPVRDGRQRAHAILQNLRKEA